MHLDTRQLKNFIIDSGLVSRAVLDRIEKEGEEKNRYVGDILVSEGFLSEDDMRRAEAYVLGISFVDLKDTEIDFDVLSCISEPVARTQHIVSYRKTSTTLEVAMLNINALQFITVSTHTILPRLTSKESLRSALLQYQKKLKIKFGDIIKREVGVINNEQLIINKKLTEDASMIKIVETIIEHALIQGASDIHIEPQSNEIIVRYRIDSMLHDAIVLPKKLGPWILTRIKILANLKLDEQQLPQDGQCIIVLNNEKILFCISVLPVYYGEKIVIHFLREIVTGWTLENMGLQGRNLESVYSALKQKSGIILTTGPAKSGTTTTLYTLIDILNKPGTNTCTIEDPIEHHIPHISQTQIKIDIGRTFSNVLRSLMHQDPDIIMVSEIFDEETAYLMMNAARTGCTMLSALHDDSSVKALGQFAHLGIPRELIANTVTIIIGQRLVRRLGDIKEQYFLTADEITTLRKIVDLDRVLPVLKEERIVSLDGEWATIPFYRPKTSNKEGGYTGLVGLYEVLKISPTIRDLILKGAHSSEIEDHAKKEGMVTLLEDGIIKAVQGITTLQEILGPLHK